MKRYFLGSFFHSWCCSLPIIPLSERVWCITEIFHPDIKHTIWLMRVLLILQTKDSHKVSSGYRWLTQLKYTKWAYLMLYIKHIQENVLYMLYGKALNKILWEWLNRKNITKQELNLLSTQAPWKPQGSRDSHRRDCDRQLERADVIPLASCSFCCQEELWLSRKASAFHEGVPWHHQLKKGLLNTYCERPLLSTSESSYPSE